MKTSFVLLGYTYYTWCQGTKDKNQGTSLIKVPADTWKNEFITARETLYAKKHWEDHYEIDMDSIENLTISFFSD